MNTKYENYGFSVNDDETVLVDSRYIAEFFNKPHFAVTQDIEWLIGKNNGLSRDFRNDNFFPGTFTDTKGCLMTYYTMTRDGFAILAMMYDRKNEKKNAYLKMFDDMETSIQYKRCVRNLVPLLTEAIHAVYPEQDTRRMITETDMIMRVALGYSVNEFRKKFNIPPKETLYGYMRVEENILLDALQNIDVGLVYSTPDIQKRKQTLEWYAADWKQKHNFMLRDKKGE